jgi:FecR-like protein
MPALASLPHRVALVAGLLLVAGASGSLAQERVGVNSAVNPEATGAPPGAPPRRLLIGQDVIFNEHITTGASGQTQLLFLDESSMSIGPNSDLTIDQFVYDPKSGTGKLAMSATRGLLRYVGGKLSKQDDAVTLRSATATLAVRGGAFIANIEPNGKTNAVFLYGKGLTINGLAGGSQTVFRPGFQSITNPGGPPSPPALQPPGQLAAFIQQLDGRTGGAGGATNIPTDTNVLTSGLSQTISGNVTQSVKQAGANRDSLELTSQTTIPSVIISTLQSTTQGTTTNSDQPVTTTTTGPFVGVSNAGSRFVSNSDFSATVGGSSSLFPLATGIAGIPTPVSDLNTLMSQSATGSYTGAAVGLVFNNGSNYAAAGGFKGTYNFGTQSGTMAINNFDGRNFTATGSAPLSGANYTFAVAQPGVAGTINGTFYGPKAAETGGNFAVQTTVGPTYLAAGIFAGKR